MSKQEKLSGSVPPYNVDPDNIPDSLKQQKRWVPWRWSKSKGKWGKVPTVKWSSDPDSWMSFDEAYAQDRGVGYILGDGVAGIDLDDCRDECTGELSDLAQQVVKLANSYTEVSPTQTGIKILLAGTLPAGHKTKNKPKGAEIEVYTTKRFFAMTGDGEGLVNDRQSELEAIYSRFVTPDPLLSQLLTLAPEGEDNESDGTFRLIRVAARCVSLDLDMATAIDLISQYQAIIPFPKVFSPSEIATRLNDAGARERTFKHTELGLAERFAKQHGANVRYCHPWGKWFIWDGTRWADDTTGEVMRLAKLTARSLYAEANQCHDPDRRAATAKFAASCESAKRLNAMLTLAKSQRPIPVAVDSLDAHPWLLNVQNGTIDLKTGKLRDHRQGDLLTKIAPTKHEPGEPTLWLAFLKHILPEPLIEYVHRLMGASLVGEVRDEIFPILHGDGANGKTVLINTWLGMLGSDYAANAAPALLQSSKHKQHPTEIAMFHAKRLVTVTETDDNCRLSEALVKQLTGGDPLTARRMHEDFWEFLPSHTLVLSSNYKPTISGTDHGIWRRVKLIPFLVKIPESEQDRELKVKLKSEYTQILAWAVKGCLAWQQRGLEAPTPITDATDTYKSDSDPFGRFVADCLAVSSEKLTRADAYEAYQLWAAENGEDDIGNKRFVARMLKIYEPATVNGVRMYRGVSLKVAA